MMIDSIEVLITALPILLKGLWVTLQISFCGLLIGLPVGALLGTLNSNKMKKPILSHLIKVYVSLIRGTPLFVQLLLIYFALPDIIKMEFTPFEAGVIALGLNSAAYIAEILRGGINSISQGQWEGCHALGYSKYKTLRYVVFPQAFTNIIPSFTNELAALVKESCILMIIGVPELMKVSKNVVARELKPLEIYLLTALLYFLTTSLIAFIAKRWEKTHEHY